MPDTTEKPVLKPGEIHISIHFTPSVVAGGKPTIAYNAIGASSAFDVRTLLRGMEDYVMEQYRQAKAAEEQARQQPQILRPDARPVNLRN